jgi:hypothetical protein
VSLLKDALDSRKLIPLLKFNNGTDVTADCWRKRRAELMTLLCENLFGYTPAPSKSVSGKIVYECKDAYAGKAVEHHINITFDTPAGNFSLPIYLFIPKAGRPLPVFLHLAFRDNLPDKYIPIEEITDHSFALAILCYKDVVNDNCHGDYFNGLGKLYIHDDRKPNEWGKIGMWAYCASRVYDYLSTVPELAPDRVAVVGHSRLGKTALWAGAQDERFWGVISNNSGFGGAAIAKHGTGERVDDFRRCGSWDWFCPNFLSFIGREDELPYDQHMLLALVAPRLLLIGSAEQDCGADPQSEFLSAYAASSVWELLGHKGLVTPDTFPSAGTTITEGSIGYHLRAGQHFLSRFDWGRYVDFLKRKL